MISQDYIIEKLQKILDQRGWTYYRLSKESGIPMSSVCNIFRSRYQPSFSTLSRLCDGLGITMAEFFSDGETDLPEDKARLLHLYDSLSSHQKELLFAYLEGLYAK